MTEHDRHVVVPGGFCVTFDQHNEATHCRVVFDPGRYDPLRVREFVDRYLRLLDALSSKPDLPIRQLIQSMLRTSWLQRLIAR